MTKQSIVPYLNQRLSDTNGKGTPKGEVGIEIEAEVNVYPRELNSPKGRWQLHQDGSLRGQGAEFILRLPISIGKVDTALVEWQDWTKDCGFRPSIRTSVHVHVNVQDKKLFQIYSIICAYWLVESLLVQYSGPTRKGNLFCLRVKDADAVCNYLVKGLNDQTFFHRVRTDDFRYAALNLAALYKFGSLEFRSMRGVYDIASISEWTHELFNLVEVASSEWYSPKEVVDFFLQEGGTTFLHKVFSRNFAEKLLALPDAVNSMSDNLGYAIELAQAIVWPTKEEINKFDPNQKPEKINQYTLRAFANPVPRPLRLRRAEAAPQPVLDDLVREVDEPDHIPFEEAEDIAPLEEGDIRFIENILDDQTLTDDQRRGIFDDEPRQVRHEGYRRILERNAAIEARERILERAARPFTPPAGAPEPPRPINEWQGLQNVVIGNNVGTATTALNLNENMFVNVDQHGNLVWNRR